MPGIQEIRNGYFSEELSNFPTLTQPAWLEVVVDGQTFPDRIPVTASPLSIRALSSQMSDSASTAEYALKSDSSRVATKALSLAEDLAVKSLNGLSNSLTIQGDANLTVQNNASTGSIQLSLKPQGTSLSGDSVKLASTVTNLQSNSIQSNSLLITPTTTQGSCTASNLGAIIYYHTAAGAAGNFMGCRYTGTAYTWVNLN